MWKKLIAWSQSEYCDLPWRKKRTLYRTLVSEIMLQQTTVATVLNHFERFVKTYPNLKSLAQASEEELLISWKGLGYYRRAKNLRMAAIELTQKYRGRFPQDYDQLVTIRGIGPYTASALLSIGKDQRALAVDANLERVLSRVHGLETPKGPKLQKDIQKRFRSGEILPPTKTQGMSFRQLNEALMDLGRTYCQSRRASCELCPLRVKCVAYSQGKVYNYPKVLEKDSLKAAERHQLSLLRVVISDDKKGLMAIKRREGQWLAGQYELPTYILSTQDQSLAQYPTLELPDNRVKSLIHFQTAITKYKITNYIYLTSLKDFKKEFGQALTRSWETLAEADRSKLSTASQKALGKIKKR